MIELLLIGMLIFVFVVGTPNIVTPDAWGAHAEGGPIAVVYSERRPKISAPKYLVDLAHRKSRGGGFVCG